MTRCTAASVVARRAAGAVLLALVLGVVGSTAYAATGSDPHDCGIHVPVDSVGGCPTTPTGGPSTTPTSPAPSTAPTTAPTTGSGQGSGDKSDGSEGSKFGEQETPEGWSGPIAKDLGQAVQGLSSELRKQLKDGLLPTFEFSRGYLSLYAIMFGLGVIVAVLAAMLATVKVAAAAGVERRLMLQAVLVRTLTVGAVCGVAPLALALVGDLTQSLAGGFLKMASDRLVSQLDAVEKALGVGTLAALVVPGGSAIMAGLFLFLLTAMAGVWLELAVSHYLVFLLGLLLPILYGASINPDWRGGVKKVGGVLTGAFLAPAALFLVWNTVGVAGGPWQSGSDTGFLSRAGMLIVSLLLSLAAPVAVGTLLSYLVPALADGRGSYPGGDISASLLRGRRITPRASVPGGPRTSRAQRASEARDAGPSVPVDSPRGLSGAGGAGGGASGAGAGAGAGGGAGGASAGGAGAAGAALGPAAIAAAAWMAVANKTRQVAGTVRDAVGSSTQRSTDGGDQPPSGPAGGPTAGGAGRGTARGAGRDDGRDAPGQGSDGSRGAGRDPRSDYGAGGRNGSRPEGPGRSGRGGQAGPDGSATPRSRGEDGGRR